jgi:hypothetical protein
MPRFNEGTPYYQQEGGRFLHTTPICPEINPPLPKGDENPFPTSRYIASCIGREGHEFLEKCENSRLLQPIDPEKLFNRIIRNYPDLDEEQQGKLFDIAEMCVNAFNTPLMLHAVREINLGQDVIRICESSIIPGNKHVNYLIDFLRDEDNVEALGQSLPDTNLIPELLNMSVFRWQYFFNDLYNNRGELAQSVNRVLDKFNQSPNNVWKWRYLPNKVWHNIYKFMDKKCLQQNAHTTKNELVLMQYLRLTALAYNQTSSYIVTQTKRNQLLQDLQENIESSSYTEAEAIEGVGAYIEHIYRQLSPHETPKETQVIAQIIINELKQLDEEHNMPVGTRPDEIRINPVYNNDNKHDVKVYKFMQSLQKAIDEFEEKTGQRGLAALTNPANYIYAHNVFRKLAIGAEKGHISIELIENKFTLFDKIKPGGYSDQMNRMIVVLFNWVICQRRRTDANYSLHRAFNDPIIKAVKGVTVYNHCAHLNQDYSQSDRLPQTHTMEYLPELWRMMQALHTTTNINEQVQLRRSIIGLMQPIIDKINLLGATRARQSQASNQSETANGNKAIPVAFPATRELEYCPL